MELFIIAAVVIIIYNIFNSLAQQGKKKQPAAPGREKPGSIGQAILMEHHYKNRPSRSRFTDQELPRELAREAPAPEPAVRAGGPASTRVDTNVPARPPGVMHGLTGMLQDQDRLVAAFVFHEIMSPPRSKRH